MGLFRSEYQIGRGETPESQIEVPFFAVFVVFAALSLFVLHVYFQNTILTAAVGGSMLVFASTVLRVEIGVYVLVIGMLLSPEMSSGTVRGGGGGWRDITVRYNDVLIAVIFFGVMVKQAFEGGRHFLLRSRINGAILLYYLTAIFSCLLALKRGVPMWDKEAALFVIIKMLEFYMIYFLVGASIRNIKQVRGQLAVFFVTASITAVYGITTIGKEARVGAPFELGNTEPNTLGGYLMMVIVLAMALFFYARTKRLKLVLILVACTAFVPFLYTLSRASYLGLLGAVLAMALTKRSLLLVVVIAAVLLPAPYLMPKDVTDRVNYTFQRGDGEDVTVGGVKTGVQVDKSTYERIYVWKKVQYNLHVWPWFGGGVGWDTVLDSQYARVIIETGLIGTAAFILMQLRILRTTLESYRWARVATAKGLALGAFCITIGLMVHSMGTISFLIVRIMEPYWFLIAMTVSMRNLALEEYHQERTLREASQDTTRNAPPKPSAPLPPHAGLHPVTSGVIQAPRA